MSNLLHHEIHHSLHSSEWVVFIHGAGGSIATWKYQLEVIKEDYNVLLIDLRDHGKSKNINPAFKKYTFDIVTSDIHKVLDHHHIEKAHFVTLSFGSVILQALSEGYPKMIDKMIIIGGIFKGNLLIKSFVHLARVLNVFLSYATMYRLFSFLLMPKKRNQRARRLYQIQAQKLTQKEYLKWVNLYGEFFRLLKTFNQQQINNPILTIMGGDDFIFLKSAERFCGLRANTILKIIPKAGHICNIERPNKVNALIKNFLGSPKVQ
ncbi:MAG: alpha/beta fold hydrolase [Ekhidna sp.]